MAFVQLLNILLLDIFTGMSYDKTLVKLLKPIRILLVSMLANKFIVTLLLAINLNKFTHFVLIGRKYEKKKKNTLYGFRDQK